MSRHNKSREKRQISQNKMQPSASILETDLSQLPIKDLLILKQKVDSIVLNTPVELNDDDLRLEYSVVLKDKEGLKYRNEGAVTMSSIMHKRALSKAPRRFENTFQDQIYIPVWNVAFDLISAKNETENKLETIQRIDNEPYSAVPGLAYNEGGFIPGM